MYSPCNDKIRKGARANHDQTYGERILQGRAGQQSSTGTREITHGGVGDEETRLFVGRVEGGQNGVVSTGYNARQS
jgi:hypothetical protein